MTATITPIVQRICSHRAHVVCQMRIMIIIIASARTNQIANPVMRFFSIGSLLSVQLGASYSQEAPS